jgi:putative oxidoreductase
VHIVTFEQSASVPTASRLVTLSEWAMRTELLRRLGQAVLGAVFLKLGSDGARSPGPRVALAANLGVPSPELAVRANGIAMTLGGAALIADRLPRAAAVGLAASMLPTTLAAHTYWHHQGPDRKAQFIHFAKNAGIVGGLLVIAGSRRP